MFSLVFLPLHKSESIRPTWCIIILHPASKDVLNILLSSFYWTLTSRVAWFPMHSGHNFVTSFTTLSLPLQLCHFLYNFVCKLSTIIRLKNMWITKHTKTSVKWTATYSARADKLWQMILIVHYEAIIPIRLRLHVNQIYLATVV